MLEIDPQLDSQTDIGRYMSFATFAALLRNKQLFFPALSTFEDQHEGSTTALNAAFESGILTGLDALANNFAGAAFGVGLTAEERERHRAEGRTKMAAPKYVDTVFGRLEQTPDRPYARIMRSQRHWIDVSCWHKNTAESLTMWKIYGGSAESVRISSTVGLLASSLTLPPSLGSYIAEVRYIDHDNDYFKTEHEASPALHKQKPYSYEQEVRAIVWNPSDSIFGDRSDKGRLATVDVRALITGVRVSPSAKPWFRELVNATMKGELDGEASQSEMARLPYP